jgi:nucleoside 2-deoxyribosyltransferase/hydroxymethylpyrimidine/phosphomethylpyrimidine kinase
VQSSHSQEMTSPLAVVGGVYRERCRLPNGTDETWGSGGRAAAVIAGLGLKVTLHTAVDVRTASLLASLAHAFHFETVEVNVKRTRQFRYDHGLSSPIIWPPVDPSEILHLEVDAENALVFGMLEATADVRAKRVVYDPQNPLAPESFKFASGLSPHIAYVLNGSEARRLVGVDDPVEGAGRIASEFGVEVVVVKQGPRGALVYENGRYEHIPAYKTESIWPIGSGDVFAAVFAARWAGQNLSAIEAAMHASRAAALYVNNRVLPISSEEIETTSGFPFAPLVMTDKALADREYHVYLAGPFFNIAQRWLVEESRLALQGMGLRVFSPLHDIGLGSGRDVAPQDVEGLKRCRAILALVDGLDAGTIFEVGYARSLEKPVVALAESTPEEPLKMITGTGCDVVSDFVTALYRVAWAARA